jgi:predicted membrane-bound spermidine synthase
MLELLIALAASAIGFIVARNFVRRRLRFVDAVQSPFAPLIAGAVAALLAWPAVLLPWVTLTTAVLFGIGTGLGTASGARALRGHSETRRRLTP